MGQEKQAARQLRRATGKEDTLEKIVELFRRILRRCLCCITCGCIPVMDLDTEMQFEAELTEEEKAAVESLLLFLESSKIHFYFL